MKLWHFSSFKPLIPIGKGVESVGTVSRLCGDLVESPEGLKMASNESRKILEQEEGM